MTKKNAQFKFLKKLLKLKSTFKNADYLCDKLNANVHKLLNLEKFNKLNMFYTQTKCCHIFDIVGFMYTFKVS